MQPYAQPQQASYAQPVVMAPAVVVVQPMNQELMKAQDSKKCWGIAFTIGAIGYTIMGIIALATNADAASSSSSLSSSAALEATVAVLILSSVLTLLAGILGIIAPWLKPRVGMWGTCVSASFMVFTVLMWMTVGILFLTVVASVCSTNTCSGGGCSTNTCSGGGGLASGIVIVVFVVIPLACCGTCAMCGYCHASKAKSVSHLEKTMGDAVQPAGGVQIQQMQPQLPPNWRQLTDNQGRVYYANTVTKETSWVVPGNAPPPALGVGPYDQAPSKQV